QPGDLFGPWLFIEARAAMAKLTKLVAMLGPYGGGEYELLERTGSSGWKPSWSEAVAAASNDFNQDAVGSSLDGSQMLSYGVQDGRGQYSCDLSAARGKTTAGSAARQGVACQVKFYAAHTLNGVGCIFDANGQPVVNSPESGPLWHCWCTRSGDGIADVWSDYLGSLERPTLCEAPEPRPEPLSSEERRRGYLPMELYWIAVIDFGVSGGFAYV
ncbi:MAG: hypothetical protein ACM359_08750, partial [Bacillota bacterium]